MSPPAETLKCGGSDDLRSSKSASIWFAVTTCECLLPATPASLPSSSDICLRLPGNKRPSKPANALSDSSWQLGVVGFVPYLKKIVYDLKYD